jgi:uncharacterized membrane protein YbhN (UPF0104 family)
MAIFKSSAIYCISLLSGAISMLPGGLGATELTAATMLEQAGVEFSIGLLAITTCRFTTLWYAILLEIVSFLFCATRRPANIVD